MYVGPRRSDATNARCIVKWVPWAAAQPEDEKADERVEQGALRGEAEPAAPSGTHLKPTDGLSVRVNQLCSSLGEVESLRRHLRQKDERIASLERNVARRRGESEPRGRRQFSLGHRRTEL